MNNILRHAGARSAEIKLHRQDSCICLDVEDDGCGFAAGQIYKNALQQQRLGLIGIRERAELVGGSLQIESEPGHGTHLKICLPLLVTGDGRDGKN
jgi:signal transduction histidine kinase